MRERRDGTRHMREQVLVHLLHDGLEHLARVWVRVRVRVWVRVWVWVRVRVRVRVSLTCAPGAGASAARHPCSPAGRAASWASWLG